MVKSVKPATSVKQVRFVCVCFLLVFEACQDCEIHGDLLNAIGETINRKWVYCKCCCNNRPLKL